MEKKKDIQLQCSAVCNFSATYLLFKVAMYFSEHNQFNISSTNFNWPAFWNEVLCILDVVSLEVLYKIISISFSTYPLKYCILFTACNCRISMQMRLFHYILGMCMSPRVLGSDSDNRSWKRWSQWLLFFWFWGCTWGLIG